jgi:hypothetical protein
MDIKLRITRKKDGTFKGDEGEPIKYFWYNAERLADNVAIQFGSKNSVYEKGDELTLDLVKTENSKGRLTWKELSNVDDGNADEE